MRRTLEAQWLALLAHALLTSAKSTEILSSFRDD